MKERLSRSKMILFVALLSGLVAPLLLAILSGNLEIPHNDSWAYSRIAQDFSNTGEIKLLGWNRASLVGQFYLFKLFFSSITIQHLFIALSSLAALISLYYLLLNYVDRVRASIGVLAMAIWPGFALLSTSFMSDIPTLATSFACLVLAHQSAKKNSSIILILSILLGFWSFIIREQAVAAPVAVIIWAIIQNIKFKIFLSRSIGAIAILFLLSIIAFEYWRSGLVNADSASFNLRTNGFFILASGFTRAWFEFSLVLLPVSLLAGVKFKFSKIRILLSGLTLCLGLFQLSYAGLQEFFLPNYLSQNGAYSSVLPPTEQLFNNSVWTVVVTAALISGAVLIFLLPKRIEYNSLINIFSLLVILGTGFQFLIDQGVFFRYLLPVIPFIYLLLVTEPEIAIYKWNWPKKVATVQISFLALLSVGLMTHSFAFDKARWDIGTRISEQNIPKSKIDAGLEWLGWHSPNGVTGDVRSGQLPDLYWGFNNLFESKPCFVLTASRNLPPAFNEITQNWYLIDQVSYRTFLGFGESRIYIYETFEPGCTFS